MARITETRPLEAQIGALRADLFNWSFIEATRALSFTARALPIARLDLHGVEQVADVAYGPLPEHRLDVYRPHHRSRPTPTVVYAHGGAFQWLSKDTHWALALLWARAGYTVFNLDYRLAPSAPFPAAPSDVARALAWVVDHAAEYGADPERLILTGESAGANLVTAVTIACTYERPEPWARELFEREIVPSACIPACGLLDVHDLSRMWTRPLPWWMRDHMGTIERNYAPGDPEDPRLALASPLRLLERGEAPARPLPPFMTFVGTKDPIRDDTYRLDRALDRLGVPCETRTYLGEIHAFHGYQPWRRNARLAWRHQYDFAARVLAQR